MGDPDCSVMSLQDVLDVAWATRDHAHAPYSGFRVGAAVVAEDGEVYPGCNVENLSFGLTMCAERVAIGAAVAAGHISLTTVVVVADSCVPVSPCGACRQVMAEFGVQRVVISNGRETLEFSLEELLPRAKAGILDQP